MAKTSLMKTRKKAMRSGKSVEVDRRTTIKADGSIHTKAFEPWAEVYEDGDRWFVEYEVVMGKKNRMGLDASTRDEAIFEAAGITDIPASKIK